MVQIRSQFWGVEKKKILLLSANLHFKACTRVITTFRPDVPFNSGILACRISLLVFKSKYLKYEYRRSESSAPSAPVSSGSVISNPRLQLRQLRSERQDKHLSDLSCHSNTIKLFPCLSERRRQLHLLSRRETVCLLGLSAGLSMTPSLCMIPETGKFPNTWFYS